MIGHLRISRGDPDKDHLYNPSILESLWLYSETSLSSFITMGAQSLFLAPSYAHDWSCHWCSEWQLHWGKWPSKFSKPQDTGSRAGISFEEVKRRIFCSCPALLPEPQSCTCTQKLIKMFMEQCLQLLISPMQQGSSPVQQARPKEMPFHSSMACHLFSARTLTNTLISFSLYPTRVSYVYFLFNSSLLPFKQKLHVFNHHLLETSKRS